MEWICTWKGNGMTIRDIVMAAAGVGGAPPPASSTDPQFNYVTMLLHGDGTNGAQNNTFVDSSTNNFTITRNGTPTQGSFSPYGTLWSNYFSGSGQYLSFTGTNAAFQFGTSDWTVECWVCPTVINADQYIWDFRPTSNGAYPALDMSSTGFKYVANAAVQITGTTAPKVGTWYHVAVCRSGTSTKLFVNGVQEGSTYSDSTNYTVAADRPYIGIDGFSGTSFPFNGYISNLRMVKGTALYTSNFTPSTTPLTAVSGTSLLTCQSNRFKDNSSNNFAITVTGTPSVQRFSPFDPAAEYSTSVIGGSGYFPGSGNYISIAGTVNQNLIGNSNFTIEAWVYSTTSSFNQTILSHTDLGSGRGFGWNLRYESGYNIKFYVGSGTAGSDNEFLTATSTGVKINEWNHIAVVRNGATVYVYVNGVQKGSAAMPATFNVTGTVPFQVGQRGTSLPEPIVGYVTNARTVSGTAVYTANFTPPTAPLTAITNTSLLLNTVNAGIFDNAMMNDLVTVGDAQVSTAVVKYGTGSMKFDGTGDWLTFVDSPNTQLGSGDFTIEGWVNLSLLGSARGIFSKGTSTTGLSLAVNALNQVVFNYTASSLTGTTALMATTWYHIAVVRSGSATGNVKIFINGTADATSGGAITDNFNQTNAGYIGADRVGTSPMNGYIDDLRITKGVARYTANFTPPTAALPNN